VKGRGAPGGVHAALVHARADPVVCVGCDMPFVTEAALAALLGALAPEDDLACYRVNGRWEPLLAVYRRAIEPRWRALLDGGPSFGELFRAFRVRELNVVELKSAVSINTEADAREHGVLLPIAAEQA
jgi:molybdopterin-guanine dinucleotide biosynthesis protein A